MLRGFDREQDDHHCKFEVCVICTNGRKRNMDVLVSLTMTEMKFIKMRRLAKMKEHPPFPKTGISNVTGAYE